MRWYSVLLRHLVEDMDGLTSQIDRHLLHETVRAFTLTNDDLTTDGAADTPTSRSSLMDIQQAGQSCQVSHLGLLSIQCSAVSLLLCCCGLIDLEFAAWSSS